MRIDFVRLDQQLRGLVEMDSYKAGLATWLLGLAASEGIEIEGQ